MPPPSTLGSGTGYLERQLRRFAGLWEHSKTREITTVDEVTRLLAERIPPSGPATIVHGDYRLGNTLFGPDAPARLAAVLDWELATVGDPLADVGYLTATWVQPSYSPGPLALSPVTALDGFPSRDDLAVAYEAKSGRRVSATRLVLITRALEGRDLPRGQLPPVEGRPVRRPVLRDDARRHPLPGRAGAA